MDSGSPYFHVIGTAHRLAKKASSKRKPTASLLALCFAMMASAREATSFGSIPEFDSFEKQRGRAVDVLCSITEIVARLSRVQPIVPTESEGLERATSDQEDILQKLLTITDQLSEIWKHHDETAESNASIADYHSEFPPPGEENDARCHTEAVEEIRRLMDFLRKNRTSNAKSNGTQAALQAPPTPTENP